MSLKHLNHSIYEVFSVFAIQKICQEQISNIKKARVEITIPAYIEKLDRVRQKRYEEEVFFKMLVPPPEPVTSLNYEKFAGETFISSIKLDKYREAFYKYLQILENLSSRAETLSRRNRTEMKVSLAEIHCFDLDFLEMAYQYIDSQNATW